MKLHKLKALEVTRANLKPGMHADGGGLYLRIAAGGSRQWIFRYRRSGRLVDMGFGGVTSLSLADARQRAVEARKLLAMGKDPLSEKRVLETARVLEEAHGTTFGEAARACIEARKSGWRNRKHAAQWLATLQTYAFPVLERVPVQMIDVSLVLKVLEPIWSKKTETASRVRQRIEAVVDWARVRGLRQGDNPARWKGHLSEILPARTKVQRVKHHRALPYIETPGFLASLRDQEGMAPLALEFQILTATRTGEVLGATWKEIDLRNGTWTIPRERIKSGRQHRVPLSERACEILSSLPHREGHVFRGQSADSGLSSNAVRRQIIWNIWRRDRMEDLAHLLNDVMRAGRDGASVGSGLSVV